MFEYCEIIKKMCAFAATSENIRYCGLGVKKKKSFENRIEKMRKCPKLEQVNANPDESNKKKMR